MDSAMIAAVLNGGALVILGYHLLWGLPNMLKDMMTAQSAERNFWANQNQLDRSAFAERAKMIAEAISQRELSLGDQIKSIAPKV